MKITLDKKHCRPGYGEVKVLADYIVEHDGNTYKVFCQVQGIATGEPYIDVETAEIPGEADQNEDTLTEESIMEKVQDHFDELR